MQLPVLFRHAIESGIVSRAKEYEIKAYHVLVDVEHDVEAFIQHDWAVVAEGEHAIKQFADLAKPTKKNDAPKPDDTPDNSPSADEADTNKAATSKGKSTAK